MSRVTDSADLTCQLAHLMAAPYPSRDSPPTTRSRRMARRENAACRPDARRRARDGRPTTPRAAKRKAAIYCRLSQAAVTVVDQSLHAPPSLAGSSNRHRVRPATKGDDSSGRRGARMATTGLSAVSGATEPPPRDPRHLIMVRAMISRRGSRRSGPGPPAAYPSMSTSPACETPAPNTRSDLTRAATAW